MNEWEGWTEAQVVTDLRRRFGDGEFPHNTTSLYYNPAVADRFLDWGVLVPIEGPPHPCGGTWRHYRLAKDAEYRVLWHTAGTDKPQELRDLAAIHRAKVRRGEVPPWLRGVV